MEASSISGGDAQIDDSSVVAKHSARDLAESCLLIGCLNGWCWLAAGLQGKMHVMWSVGCQVLLYSFHQDNMTDAVVHWNRRSCLSSCIFL